METITGRIRGLGAYGRPRYNQAAKIIRKFGGEAEFAKAVGISRVTAYRWNYARPYGTDGLVPSHSVERVNRAARLHGVVLLPQDWIPERIEYPQPQHRVKEETQCQLPKSKRSPRRS